MKNKLIIYINDNNIKEYYKLLKENTFFESIKIVNYNNDFKNNTTKIVAELIYDFSEYYSIDDIILYFSKINYMLIIAIIDSKTMMFAKNNFVNAIIYDNNFVEELQ